MNSDPQSVEEIPRYAVMGNPVGHSRSPFIHRSFATQFGQAMEYVAIEAELGGFAEAVARFQNTGGRGLNVTVPFKEQAWELAGELTERARLAQAVNTLCLRSGEKPLGDNTDGAGLLQDLQENLGFKVAGCSVLVVGGGGAVRGVVGPLLEAQPAGLVVANRTARKAEIIAERFSAQGSIAGCGFEALTGETFDLIINGTAASLSGQVPKLPTNLFRINALAYDMMYGPSATPFMTWAQAQGAAQVADGLGMLVEQAAESFFLWRGLRPHTAPVIAALRASSIQ